MKTKQLANVLIKILGLSVCVHAVPNLFFGFFSLVRATGGSESNWFYLLPSLLLVVIGIYLIVRSRNVAACLFKGEEE